MVIIELEDKDFKFAELKERVLEVLRQAIKITEGADFLAISRGQVDSPKVWVRISF